LKGNYVMETNRSRERYCGVHAALTNFGFDRLVADSESAPLLLSCFGQYSKNSQNAAARAT